MKVTRIRALRGPNLWSRHTAIEAVVACEGDENAISKLAGFEARLRARFPTIGELHPMVLLFFILGGVEAFGFLGLFLGPVVAAVLTAVFAMLREEVNEAGLAPAASGVP